MRFQDIPKFFSARPMYEIEQPLNGFDRFISNEIKQGLTLNPDFQRGHVWTMSQQSEFMEYMLQGGKSGLELYFNSTNYDRGEPCVCVDGLQRITAALGFLSGKVKVFGAFIYEFEDRPHTTGHRFKIRINNLQERSQVLQWYLQMNTGGVVHTELELYRVRALLDAETVG